MARSGERSQRRDYINEHDSMFVLKGEGNLHSDECNGALRSVVNDNRREKNKWTRVTQNVLVKQRAKIK